VKRTQANYTRQVRPLAWLCQYAEISSFSPGNVPGLFRSRVCRTKRDHQERTRVPQNVGEEHLENQQGGDISMSNNLEV
jgi:hypothetical protein